MAEIQNRHREAIKRISRSIGKYDIVIENEFFNCRVYWARVIGSETESLFTAYTKHTFYELQYALEGCIVMLIDGERQITINPTDFMVIPPDTYHQIIDGDSVGSRFIMAFSLEVKNPSLSNLCAELSTLVPHHETVYMLKLIALLVGKDCHDDTIHRRLIESYLECFILELIEAVLPTRPQSGARTESLDENTARVRQITDYIAEYNGIGVSVKDIAKSFSLSERHLNRLFNAACGISPKQAINHQKLKKIEELVTATSLSFSEISELCGFSDEYTMNKFFKRHTHHSLTEYRALRDTKAAER